MNGAGLRLLAALWFGAAGAVPGLGVLLLDAGKIGSPLHFYLQLIVLPAASAAFWGALLGPGIVHAGRGWAGLRRSLERGGTVPMLSLPTWALLAVTLAALSGVYPVKLIVFVAAVMATLGGLFLYPLGMTAGLLLWRLAGR